MASRALARGKEARNKEQWKVDAKKAGTWLYEADVGYANADLAGKKPMMVIDLDNVVEEQKVNVTAFKKKKVCVLFAFHDFSLVRLDQGPANAARGRGAAAAEEGGR